MSPEEEKEIDSVQSVLTVSARYYTAHIEGNVSGGCKTRISVTIDKQGLEGKQVVRWIEE